MEDIYPRSSVALLCNKFLLVPRVIVIDEIPARLHVSEETDRNIFMFLEYLEGKMPIAPVLGLAYPTRRIHLLHLMETHLALSTLRANYDLDRLHTICGNYYPLLQDWGQRVAIWQRAMDEALAATKSEFYSVYEILDEDEKEVCAPYATNVPRV
ncbi:hypothetical protein FRC03_004260 [Tulasnella sp. 419]|nr:hypothetical protein FRC03_004260 [Tulasnella sp. 419]